jgi:hypothetical protein
MFLRILRKFPRVLRKFPNEWLRPAKADCF